MVVEGELGPSVRLDVGHDEVQSLNVFEDGCVLGARILEKKSPLECRKISVVDTFAAQLKATFRVGVRNLEAGTVFVDLLDRLLPSQSPRKSFEGLPAYVKENGRPAWKARSSCPSIMSRSLSRISRPSARVASASAQTP